MSTPRRGPSQSSSCMCLGPRSYRTDSAPVSLSLSHPLLLPVPSHHPSRSPPSIRTLNEGCNAENALAFNNQEAFSSQQLLSSQGCLPISHTICVFFFFFLSLPSTATGKMNVTSCLTNMQRYTHPAFDSTKTPHTEKQKQGAQAAANTNLKNSLICKTRKITQRLCYYRVRQYYH